MKQGCVILLAVFLTLHVEASDTRDAFDNLIKPVFQENCTKCHGEKGKVKGKLNLLKINALPKFQEDAERIEKIEDQMDSIYKKFNKRYNEKVGRFE